MIHFPGFGTPEDGAGIVKHPNSPVVRWIILAIILPLAGCDIVEGISRVGDPCRLQLEMYPTEPNLQVGDTSTVGASSIGYDSSGVCRGKAQIPLGWTIEVPSIAEITSDRDGTSSVTIRGLSPGETVLRALAGELGAAVRVVVE